MNCLAAREVIDLNILYEVVRRKVRREIRKGILDRRHVLNLVHHEDLKNPNRGTSVIGYVSAPRSGFFYKLFCAVTTV